MDKSTSLFSPPPPLAARMRPRTLNEFVGQAHLVGPGRLLWRSLKAGRLFASMIFWGPRVAAKPPWPGSWRRPCTATLSA